MVELGLWRSSGLLLIGHREHRGRNKTSKKQEKPSNKSGSDK